MIMNEKMLINRLKRTNDILPNEFDGTYRAVRKAIEYYTKVKKTSLFDCCDLELLYYLSVGIWRNEKNECKHYVQKTHLLHHDKQLLTSAVEKIWSSEARESFDHVPAKEEMAFLMTPVSFREEPFAKRTGDIEQLFKLCINIAENENDVQLYETAEKMLVHKGKASGIPVYIVSRILHCMKPFTFPILGEAATGSVVFRTIDMELGDINDTGQYVSNCRKIMEYRSTQFKFKNMRIFDIMSWYLLGEEEEALQPEDTAEDEDEELPEEKPKPVKPELKKAQPETAGRKQNHVTVHLLKHGQDNGEPGKPAQPIPAPAPAAQTAPEEAAAPKSGLRKRDLVQARLEAPLNLILYGPPGTGKTYNIVKHAVELIEGHRTDGEPYKAIRKRYNEYAALGQVKFTTFHQSLSYEEFVEGIRPIVVDKYGNATSTAHSDTTIVYRPYNGVFKSLCEKAGKNPHVNYVAIIDEINRGNISKIFGELITLIEESKRGTSVILPYSQTEFTVPPNLYILGTMNTADRSIAMLDTALRRRFDFIEMMPQPSLLGNCEGVDLCELLTAMNERIEYYYDREHAIGHAYFMSDGGSIKTLAELRNVFSTKIIPLLQEYFFDDYERIKLILNDENTFIECITPKYIRKFDSGQKLYRLGRPENWTKKHFINIYRDQT